MAKPVLENGQTGDLTEYISIPSAGCVASRSPAIVLLIDVGVTVTLFEPAMNSLEGLCLHRVNEGFDGSRASN